MRSGSRVLIYSLLAAMLVAACDVDNCVPPLPKKTPPPAESASVSSSARNTSVVAAGAGALLPMLNAFPSCVSTLDIGFTEAEVQFGAMVEDVLGTFACAPVNNPVQINVTEGAVDIAVESAVIALPDPNPQTSVARFAIEGRASITGGTASAAPSWLLQVAYRFPHSGSPTGAEPIVFGATLVEANDDGGAPPVPAVGEVRIDCGLGVTTLLLNEGPMEIPVEAASSCGATCECVANAQMTGGAAATAGETVQRLTVFAYNINGLCGASEQCRATDPMNPFCVDNFGCSNGSIGMPCDHDSQCDRASGFFCDAGRFCADGSVGVACSQAGDCAAGLSCTGNLCSSS